MADNTESGTIEPSLGLTWSNTLTNRFILSKCVQTNTRELKVLFAPDLPSNRCKFKIAKNGIVAID